MSEAAGTLVDVRLAEVAVQKLARKRPSCTGRELLRPHWRRRAAMARGWRAARAQARRIPRLDVHEQEGGETLPRK